MKNTATQPFKSLYTELRLATMNTGMCMLMKGLTKGSIIM